MVNAGLAEDAAAPRRCRAPTASACSGPNSSSWSRRPCRAASASSGSIRRCSPRRASKPVVFRTVDIGGDKALPYLADVHDEAENPAMGWRALRLSLDRSTLMRAQARALIEASAGKVLRVMFPMVSEPWEFEDAKALFEEQVEWARKRATASCPSTIEYGAMLEVPSLAEMLDILLPQGRFPVDRDQRSDPVPVRRRPRRPAAGRALRLAQPGDPALPEARARRRAARPTCRCAFAARWPAGRSRRWR